MPCTEGLAPVVSVASETGVEVVMALGIEGAAAYEPQETLVGEVVGVAVQVFGAHRTDDDLYDQPRRFGRRRAECRGQSEKGEEIAEFHHSIY